MASTTQEKEPQENNHILQNENSSDNLIPNETVISTEPTEPSTSLSTSPSTTLSTEGSISKREQNRRKRQALRDATRTTWLANKKLKRKLKQQEKREKLKEGIHGNLNEQIDENSNEEIATGAAEETCHLDEQATKKFNQETPSVTIIFDLSFDDYMLPKVPT